MSYEYIRRQNSDDPTKYALQFEIELLNKKLLKKKLKILDIKKDLKFNEFDKKKLNFKINTLNDKVKDLEQENNRILNKYNNLKKIMVILFILYMHLIKNIF